MKIPSLLITSFFFSLTFTPTTAAANSTQPCGITQGLCNAGCYNAQGTNETDGSRNCEPVGPGFYSPMMDDLRRPCESGTYSDSDTAATCSLCDAGSYSDEQATECHLCPSGFYNTAMGAQLCMQCNPRYYNGTGADFAIYLELPDEETGQINRDLYCLEPATAVPSPMVTMEPIPERDQPAPPAPNPTSAPTVTVPSTPTTAPTVLPPESTTIIPTAVSQTPTSRMDPTESPSPSPTMKPSDANEGNGDGSNTMSPTDGGVGGRGGFDNVNDNESGPSPSKNVILNRYLMIGLILVGIILIFALFVMWTRFRRSQKAKQLLHESREAFKNRPVPPPPSPAPDQDVVDSDSESVQSFEDADLFYDDDQLDEMENATSIVFSADPTTDASGEMDVMDQESVVTDIGGASTWSVPVAIRHGDEDSI